MAEEKGESAVEVGLDVSSGTIRYMHVQMHVLWCNSMFGAMYVCGVHVYICMFACEAPKRDGRVCEEQYSQFS